MINWRWITEQNGEVDNRPDSSRHFGVYQEEARWVNASVFTTADTFILRRSEYRWSGKNINFIWLTRVIIFTCHQKFIWPIMVLQQKRLKCCHFFRGSSLLGWWIPQINSATFTWTSSQRSVLPLLWRQRRHDSYDTEKNEKLKTT